jgi:RNA polymerase sigma factor (sigma-70 family)
MIEPNVIKLAIQRDRKAYKLIYETCSPYVFSIITRYINQTNDHKDVLQEVFARIFLSLNTYDQDKGLFKYWLRKVAVNECFQYLRKQKKSAQVIPIAGSEEEIDDVEGELTKLTKSDIEHLLIQMPNGYRKVFMLIAIDDFSHKEVAEMLDISVDTSRSQYSRARVWLQKNIVNNNHKIISNGIKIQ